MPPDIRKTVGGSVSALASNVTHLSECHRHYGSNTKTKRVSGTVLSVEKRPTKTGRSSTWIHTEFDFGSRTTKKAVLFISSLRAEVAEPAALIATAAPGDGDLPSSIANTAPIIAPVTTPIVIPIVAPSIALPIIKLPTTAINISSIALPIVASSIAPIIAAPIASLIATPITTPISSPISSPTLSPIAKPIPSPIASPIVPIASPVAPPILPIITPPSKYDGSDTIKIFTSTASIEGQP